jgi:hypothetical protein
MAGSAVATHSRVSRSYLFNFAVPPLSFIAGFGYRFECARQQGVERALDALGRRVGQGATSSNSGDRAYQQARPHRLERARPCSRLQGKQLRPIIDVDQSHFFKAHIKIMSVYGTTPDSHGRMPKVHLRRRAKKAWGPTSDSSYPRDPEWGANIGVGRKSNNVERPAFWNLLSQPTSTR